MQLWTVTVTVVVTLAVVGGASQVKLVDNGYEDVVVAISPSVDEAQAPNIISKLKRMLRKGSAKLYRATTRHFFFRSAKILIPPTWTNTDVDQVATTQTFQDSDIRVDQPVAGYLNKPFTQQPFGCGEPGVYIHFTPQYLTNRTMKNWYGKEDIVLVVQWAMLRWGIFEEFGYHGDNQYPVFYKSGHDYKINYCADKEARFKTRDRNTGKKCDLDPVSAKPNDNCVAEPRRRQRVISSLLSYPFILNGQIVEFCNKHTHNKEAPNKHNAFCNGASAWEVMRRHNDFKQNRPMIQKPDDPVVQVVQAVAPSFVLVLDYSGSMSYSNRIEKLQKSAQRWILYDVQLGSKVAVVRFSSQNLTKVLVPLTEITSQSVRQDLVNLIPTDIDGATSIGSGLIEAMKLLEGEKNKNIMVVTDGQETEQPHIADVRKDVVRSGACVTTIAFGTDADDNLELLGEKTGCPSYTVDDDLAISLLQAAFESTRSRVPQDQEQDFHYIFKSPTHETQERLLTGDFTVDSTIGRELTFQLITSNDKHVTSPPRLFKPDGTELTLARDKYNPSMKTWMDVIPLAEVGVWRWEVDLDGDPRETINVQVKAKQRDSSQEPIIANIRASAPATGVSAVNQVIKLIADVRQGRNPVRNANVVAIVSLTGSTAQPDEYELRDNGVDPDTTEGDGLYTGYMTHFTKTGRYILNARVTRAKSSPGGGSVGTTGRRRRRRSLLDPDQDLYDYDPDPDFYDYDPDPDFYDYDPDFEYDDADQDFEYDDADQDFEYDDADQDFYDYDPDLEYDDADQDFYIYDPDLEYDDADQDQEYDDEYYDDDNSNFTLAGRPPACCGSKVPLDPSSQLPVEDFTRELVGPVIKVTEVPPEGKDGIVPSRVMDLEVEHVILGGAPTARYCISLTWTAPGDDLNEGTVAGYELRITDNDEALSDEEFRRPRSSDELQLVDPAYTGHLQAAGTRVSLNVTYDLKFDHKYYVALRAVDDEDNYGAMSKVVHFTLEEKLLLPPWAIRLMAKLRRGNLAWSRARHVDPGPPGSPSKL